MYTVERHTTLPTRSRCSRRQLQEDVRSDSLGISLPATRRPSTASGFRSVDECGSFDPPSVQLFGTVGKSPRIVRKTSHSKGGSFHSLGRSEGGREKNDEDNSNVRREVRKSVKYKPAPILAHTIVINRTTEIIKETLPPPEPPATSGSFGDVSLNEFVTRSSSTVSADQGANEDCLETREDHSVQKPTENSRESQEENVDVSIRQSVRTNEEVNLSATEGESAKSHAVDRSEKLKIKVGDDKAEVEENEENWVTETEEIRWKVITETFSDGSIRYSTVKDGEEMWRTEVAEGTDSPPLTRVRSGIPYQVARASSQPHAIPLEQPPPATPRALELSTIPAEESEAALVEVQRRRIAEIEYLQEQLCQHLNCGQTSDNYEKVAFFPPFQSTPVKRFEADQILHPSTTFDAFHDSSSTREKYEERQVSRGHFSTGGSKDRLGMPESDQHYVATVGSGANYSREIDMGEVLLSEDMSFEAIAAEIRRTMTQTGSVLSHLIEQKEKAEGSG